MKLFTRYECRWCKNRNIKGQEEGTIAGAWKERFLRIELERLSDLQSREPASSRQTHRESDGK